MIHIQEFEFVEEDGIASVVPFGLEGGTCGDDIEIGAAAVGGLLLGGVGAIVGAAGGKRKGKKVVNTMALRIDLSSFDMPSAIVSYIAKPTKTTDKEYSRAVSEMQSAMSCLDLVLEQSGR